MGGLLASLAAHLLVLGANRLGNAHAWLKGPYGPDFFDMAMVTSVLYAGIGAGLSRRPRAALLGFSLPFLSLSLPLAFASRSQTCAALLDRPAAWPWPFSGNPMVGWYLAVVVLLTASTWGAIFLLGFEPAGWPGGFSTVAGALLGYALYSGLLWAFPPLRPIPLPPFSLIPQTCVLLDAVLTGAGMGLGLSLQRRYRPI